MRYIIVEDSRLARLELKALLQKHPQLQLVGEAANLPDAKDLIEQAQPDLVMLDIDLGGDSAFDLLAQLVFVPRIIFTTAFADHALQAFNYPTVDYLLKPVSESRLAAALAKLNWPAAADDDPEAAATQPLTPLLDLDASFFVKDGERCFLLRLGDVELFEAIGNYSKVWAGSQAPLVYRSLGSIEQRLAPGLFFRANRHQLVNLKAIRNIDAWLNGGLLLILASGQQVEVSRRQSSLLRQQLSL
jgi:two-component system LytT family response regulator